MSYGSIIGIVLTLLSKREEIGKLINDAISLWNNARSLWPSVAPQLTKMAESAAATSEASQPAVTSAAAADPSKYTIEWLRDGLNKLVGSKLTDKSTAEEKEEAVKKFQKQYGLRDVDGWAGIETMAAMEDALK